MSNMAFRSKGLRVRLKRERSTFVLEEEIDEAPADLYKDEEKQEPMRFNEDNLDVA